ncbi:MAG: extensin family protein [Rhizobiaceae bacterium]|nr:extensin family protein [Rhizobiaceae bacterium]
MKVAKAMATFAAAFVLISAFSVGISGSASGTTASLPEQVRVPDARPQQAGIRPAPMTGGLPGGEHACRARLVALGVSFETLPEIDGEGACGIPYPIKVTSLGDGVGLQPAGVMNCATAEAAARLVADAAQPEAMRLFGKNISAVRQSSAYVCRLRSSGEKLSEHATGNALDISAFVLSDGHVVEVRKHEAMEKAERRFQRTVRNAACGPFKTVLGPGTDPDHATHFHLDLAERRNDGTYCR